MYLKSDYTATKVWGDSPEISYQSAIVKNIGSTTWTPFRNEGLTPPAAQSTISS